jgi:hypothetical protein
MCYTHRLTGSKSAIRSRQDELEERRRTKGDREETIICNPMIMYTNIPQDVNKFVHWQSPAEPKYLNISS